MTTLTMPGAPGLAASRFGLRANTQRFVSPLNKAVQTLELPGALWTAEYELPPMSQAQAAAWRAFLTQLRGGAGRFSGFDPDHRSPAAGDLSIPAATNLALQGQTIDASPWTTTGASIFATAQTAPDGTTTAKKLLEAATGNTTHVLVQQGVNFVAATQYTLSVFAKAGQRSQFRLELSDNAAFPAATNADFDLIAKTASSGGGADAARVTELTNGWFRCELTATADATGASAIWIYLMVNGIISYISGGGIGLALWGCQVETGATASPYVPTATVAATRPAGPVVKGAGQTGASLLTWGWPATGAAPLSPGDYLAVGGELKIVTGQAVTDAVFGQARIAFEPPLRAMPADNAAITIINPTCTMMLVDDDRAAWDADAMGIVRGLSFTAVEALS